MDLQVIRNLAEGFSFSFLASGRPSMFEPGTRIAQYYYYSGLFGYGCFTLLSSGRSIFTQPKTNTNQTLEGYSCKADSKVLQPKTLLMSLVFLCSAICNRKVREAIPQAEPTGQSTGTSYIVQERGIFAGKVQV